MNGHLIVKTIQLNPRLGAFGTLTEAGEFYINYARLAGFSVRKKTSLLDMNRELVGKYFLCLKEGFKEDRKIKQTDGLTEKGKEQRK